VSFDRRPARPPFPTGPLDPTRCCRRLDRFDPDRYLGPSPIWESPQFSYEVQLRRSAKTGAWIRASHAPSAPQSCHYPAISGGPLLREGPNGSWRSRADAIARWTDDPRVDRGFAFMALRGIALAFLLSSVPAENTEAQGERQWYWVFNCPGWPDCMLSCDPASCQWDPDCTCDCFQET
jgi:hypothetical protein